MKARWMPGSAHGSPLRLSVDSIERGSTGGWSTSAVLAPESDFPPITLLCSALVSDDGGASWVPDEGGRLTIQFEREFPQRNFDTHFCVGAYANRIHPGEFADDDEEVEEPSGPEWWQEKYMIYASGPSAFPGLPTAEIHRMFMTSVGRTLEAIVAGEANRRPDTGVMEGGRIFSLSFVL
ncbi:MAG: hypothetical protein GC206_03080 [Alphaproteobacteria bacterium]|nr:hypothetical protein [Alphaproteobacteria bacterium]